MSSDLDSDSPTSAEATERLEALRRVGRALDEALRSAGTASRATSVQRASYRWSRPGLPRPWPNDGAERTTAEDTREADENAERVIGPLSGVYVMVVDDNADSRDILEAALRRQGALVVACSSSMAGLRLVTNIAPDVLISDLAMPARSGAWLIRAVRRMPGRRAARVPAIAITAYRESQSRAKALAAGFDEYMEKPIDLDRLCRLVARLAAERRSSPPWIGKYA